MLHPEKRARGKRGDPAHSFFRIMNTGWKAKYLVLVYKDKKSSKYLGSYNPNDPTCLLDSVLDAMPRLTVSELKALLDADKKMRV